MKDKINFREKITTSFWALKLAWKINKRLLIIWGGLTVCFSVLPAVMLGFNRDVIARITAYIQNGEGSFSSILLPIIWLGLILISISLAQRFNADFFSDIMYDSYCLGLQEIMIDKVQNIPMKQFLYKEFKDEYMYVGTKYYNLVNFISNICDFGGKIISIISMLIVAFTISKMIFWFSIIYAVFAFTLSDILSRPTPDLWEYFRKLNRLSDYYTGLPLEPAAAKEIRIYESEKYVLKQYHTVDDQLRKRDMKWNLRKNAGQLGLDLGFFVIMGLSLGFSIPNVAAGVMSTDIFLMIYTMCQSLYNAFNGSNQKIAFITDNLFNLEKIRNFLRRTDNFAADVEKISEVDIENEPVFEANNLSFAYSDKPVLKNLNFKIMQGDVIALVGLNGSGKTTLTQLLLGLYAPTEGELLMYGKPIGKLSMAFLRSKIGVFFQQITLFHLSMSENVGFGDIDRVNDKDRIMNAIEKGGSSELLSKLENGLDTLLLREVERTGRNLSGGEQQKVAVSRAHMGDKDILIFDEPASMLDPIAETEQFMNIKEKIEGRTAVLISHRIGFARLAGRIMVLKDGELAETGTHEELMKLGGEYARFFEQQAEWYTTNGVKA